MTYVLPCAPWRGDATFAGTATSPIKVANMKKTAKGTLVAIAACALLSACAATGTRVTSNSDTYKSMADSQRWWCSQVGCGCTLDGQAATCSLVQACINSGNCRPAQ
jgi:hypothetical protein